MYKLYIDTHSSNIIYVLYDGEEVKSKHISESSKRHGDVAMPALVSFLNNLNVKVSDLEEIIVNIGPGSFTGIRIGVTIGKMLAYTLNIPIKTISSLEEISLNYDGYVLITSKDTKGYYCALFKDKKLEQEYFYLSNNDYLEYIKDKSFNIIEDTNVNYSLLGKHIPNIKQSLVHNVKPLYVKVIEALK